MNININFKLIFKLCLLQIIFIFALRTQVYQTVLGFLCWLYLAYIFFSKGIQRTIYVLTIIGILTFDQSSFVFEEKSTQMVNFFALPFFGMYPFVIISLFLFLYSANKLVLSRKVFENFHLESYKLVAYILFFIFIGCVIGTITSLVNGSNEAAIKYDLFRFVIILTYLPIYSYFLHDKFIAQRYVSLIFHFLISCGLITLFSILTGNVGYYGIERDIVPLVPLYSVFCSSLIAYYLIRKNSFSIFYVFSVLNIVLTVLYGNALGGKAWIILTVALLFVAINHVRSKFGILFIAIASLIFLNLDSFNLLSGQSVSSVKLEEFFSAINIFDPNWYASMSNSPKFRIDEFINVFWEYQENPNYMFLGKGIGGYVSDHTQTFGMFNNAAFDDSQYIKKQFYSLHESVNVIFLKFGMLGLLGFLYLVYRLFKVSLKYQNPSILIGTLWLLFFVSYSYELMFFGAPCLIAGLRLSENKKYVINYYR